MRQVFHGAWVAVVTPNIKGHVDSVLEGLVEKFKCAGVQGIFALGTTGEGFLLTPEERKFYAERFVDVARDKGLGVIIHVGHDLLGVALHLAEHAASLKATAISVACPAHFRLDSQEMIKYFTTIAKAVDIPMLLYDIPGTTGNSLTPDVLGNIFANTSNIVGIKVSHTDLLVWNFLFDYAKSHDISLLVGTDTFCLAALAQGASGIVSGPANIFPELYVGIIRSVKEGSLIQAQKYQQAIDKLCDILHHGVPLAFVKESVRILGYEVGPVRAPLRGLRKEEKDELQREITKLARDVAGSYSTKGVSGRS